MDAFDLRGIQLSLEGERKFAFLLAVDSRSLPATETLSCTTRNTREGIDIEDCKEQRHVKKILRNSRYRM